MLLRLLLTASVAILGACHVDFGDSDRFHEDFHYSYKVSPGSRLAIDTQNGGIDISTWDRDEIEINGTKNAATEELLKSLKIDISATPNSVRVRVDKPSAFQGNCGVRFAIRVPKKLELEKIKSSNGGIQVNGVEGPADLQTSNGRIEAVRMAGKLTVQTSNGSIDLSGHKGSVQARTSNGKISGDIAKGWLDAHTSNGGIDVQLDEVDSQEPLRMETSNGNITVSLKAAHAMKARTSNSGITVKLPEKIDAVLRARTSNSRVETDFVDMDKRGDGSNDDDEKKHKSLDAKIGAGGPVIDLSTSNGNIRILKRT
jgi:DUF4097 and DUF4098 domain-containing protein YvlB